jgi:hypothetical protein
MDGLRTSTPKVPISQSAAVTATHFFCQAIIKIAAASNYVGGNTWLLALLALALAAAVVVPMRRTRWHPVETETLAGERATGQLLRAAGRLYVRRAPPMLALALIVAAFTAAVVYVERLLADRTVLPIDLAFADPRLDNLAGVVVAAPAYPLVLVLVGSPFVVLLRRVDAGEPADVWPTIREVVPLLPRLLLLELIAIVCLLLLALTVVGLPLAIKKAVDWTFGAQEIVFHDRRARAALAESTRRVRGRWRAVAAVDVALFFVGALLGPLVGSVLIVFTDLSLSTINAVGVAIFAIALPYMATALTLLYLDPRTQAEVQPSAWSRRVAGILRRERALAGAPLVRMPR